MGAPSGVQRDLEEPVQHWVQGPRGVAQGVGLADLVEDLVLAQDGAVQAAGDVDEVACRGGVLESQPAGWQLGELAVAERAKGDVQLDPVAGVHEDDRVMGRQCLALGGERLAGRAGHTPGVSDEGQHGGRRRLAQGGDRSIAGRHRVAVAPITVGPGASQTRCRHRVRHSPAASETV